MKVLRTHMMCLLFLLFYPVGLSSDAGPKVLLINSDASVEKYAVVQSEFEYNLSYPVKSINLAEKKWKLKDIEGALYDAYPDLIYCIGAKAYIVANRFIPEKDTVFSSIINWRRLPLTKNTYGVSSELPPEMQMMLFRHIFPDLRKIGVLYSEKYNAQWVDQATSSAENMGLEIIGRALQTNQQTVSALREIMADVDAFWLISDPVILSDQNILTEIFKTCDSEKMPVFSYHEAYAEQGAALVVSVDNATIGRQAAGIAAEVLTGNRIKEKVQYPAGSQIILNLKKVKAYDLKYNEEALASVNRIIE